MVSRISPALLGTAVGGVIVLTNSQKLVHFFGIHWPWSTAIYTLIVVAWVALVVYAWRTSRAPQFAPDVEPEPALDDDLESGDARAIRIGE